MLSAVTVLLIVVGLVQLPILTDLLIFLFPTSPLPRLASRATKPVFVLLFLSCCALALHLFFFTFLPVTLHSHHDQLTPTSSLILTISLCSLALYIILNMLYYYILASFTPASPPLPIASPSSTSCKQCGAIKTHRTHHCRICNRCSTLYDHHCPFTANCVGVSTLRPFYLWLTFCVIGLYYGATLSYPAFTNCILHRSSLPLHSTSNFTFTPSLHPPLPTPFTLYSLSYCRSLSNVSWTFLLVAFGAVPVTGLWLMQTLMMEWDWTTIEVIGRLGGKRRKEVSERREGDGGEGGNRSGGVDDDKRMRKSWSLIHRDEPLYRLMLPDPIWRAWGVNRSKTRP